MGNKDYRKEKKKPKQTKDELKTAAATPKPGGIRPPASPITHRQFSSPGVPVPARVASRQLVSLALIGFGTVAPIFQGKIERGESPVSGADGMITNKAIAELERWATAASEGNVAAAEDHLQQFYHIGAALLAAKDFQAGWLAAHKTRLDPHQLEDTCALLSAIAEAEANQVMLHGRACSSDNR